MSIEKRGNKYLARVSRQIEGKQKQTAKSFRLRKDAERWEREQKGKIERGEWVQPSKQTVNAYLDAWLEGPMDVRQRTRADYRRILASYIRPTLGAVRLDQLGAHMVRTTMGALTSRGLSAGTVRYAHGVLRLALNAAVEDRLLTVNPAAGKRMTPAATRTPVTVLSRADVLRLLAATCGTRLSALWNLLVYTGMRPGEALGLQWGEVHLGAGCVRVQRALVPQKKDPATGRTWRLEEPKTERSRRAIPLLPGTVEALKWHRIRQDAEKIAEASAYTDHGFVFASPSGEPLREDVVYKQLRRMIAHLNAEIQRQAEASETNPVRLPLVTLYALRHTAATLMLEAGVPMKVVQERLGHATMMLTADTYSHVSASLQARAVEDLARYMALQ